LYHLRVHDCLIMDTISNFLCVEKMGWSDAYRETSLE
jgi:hypothetical protein